MGKSFELYLEGIPQELRLILEILKLEDDSNVNKSIQCFHTIDWELFFNLVMHHRLYPVLFSKLKEIDHNLIPAHVVQKIGHAYRKNTFHMLYLSGEMEQVCNIFNDNQIRVLVLKGPALAMDLYGDLSLRTCGDLDVLIPITELDKVDEILLKLGYEKDEYIQTVLNDWTWRHHHFTYFHRQKRIKLEVHWRLNPFPGKEPSFDELWGRRRGSSRAFSSSTIFSLGREDLFLFLVSHGARHGWSRLRWLVDVNQMVKQGMDWESLCKHLKKYQYLYVGGQAVVLSLELLSTATNLGMKKLIQGSLPKRLAQSAVFYLERMVNLHSESVPEEVSSYHKRHLFCLMSKRQKLLFAMSFLFPYPDDATTLPLPKQLHLLYFPLRPFLWAWRKTRNHATS